MTAGLLAVLLLVLGGCASSIDSGDRSPAAPGPDGRFGLEVVTWPLADVAGTRRLSASMARAFAGLGSPHVADADVPARWREAGLRVLSVPEERLAGVHTTLPMAGVSTRTAMGSVPRWSVLLEGKAWASERAVRGLPGGEVLPAGRMRLLARAWIVPGEAEGTGEVPALLHVELAPQFVASRAAIRPWELPDLSREGEGAIIAPLVLTLDLEPGSAVVIVPEDPGVDWARLLAQEPAGEEEGAAVVGPPAGERLLVGELMMTDAAAARAPRVRVGVAIIPRLPASFRMLP